VTAHSLGTRTDIEVSGFITSILFVVGNLSPPALHVDFDKTNISIFGNKHK
jgi:hypothetical protein